MASDQETTAGGNRSLEETPPPLEQELMQGYDLFDAAAPPARTQTHHVPPREAPLHEIIFPGLDLEEEEPLAVPPPFHPWVARMIEWEASTPPVLVFEKRLSSADVSLDFRRLFIRRGWRLSQALTAREKKRGLMVSAADPTAFHCNLRLSGRGAAAPMEFVVGGEWIEVVYSNGLKKGDRVEGWGFRVGKEFRLALHFIKEEEQQVNNMQ